MHAAKEACVDYAVCINLLERPDRYERAKRMFEELSLPVAFHRTHRHPTNGQLGCLLSHVAVLRDALQRGARHVIVFEDDAIATPAMASQTVVSSVFGFIKSLNATQGSGVEYLQLGYSILPHDLLTFLTAPRLAPFVLSYCSNLTHAYVMTRRGIMSVLKGLEDLPSLDGIDIDVFYSALFRARGTGACVAPQLFVQDFCNDAGDNVKATTPYYAAMRNMACFSTTSQVFFRISAIRAGSALVPLCVFAWVMLVLIIVLVKKTRARS